MDKLSLKMKYLRIIFLLFISFQVLADDNDTAKKNLVDKMTSSISSALTNMIDGEGDTQVQITTGEDYHPEFSIVTVRPLAAHPGVDAWFIQLQLNETKIRGDGRLSVNSGIGYRKLSDDKTSLTGANVFIDYDQKGNARASIGLELKS